MNYTQRPKSRRSAGYKPVKAEKPAKTEQASEKEEKPARKKENIFVKLSENSVRLQSGVSFIAVPV